MNSEILTMIGMLIEPLAKRISTEINICMGEKIQKLRQVDKHDLHEII